MTAVSPLKRATIFCRDIEASLALYRDILGFDVAEDKLVEGSAMGAMIGYPQGVKMRIVHLQSEKSDTAAVFDKPSPFASAPIPPAEPPAAKPETLKSPAPAAPSTLLSGHPRSFTTTWGAGSVRGNIPAETGR